MTYRGDWFFLGRLRVTLRVLSGATARCITVLNVFGMRKDQEVLGRRRLELSPRGAVVGTDGGGAEAGGSKGVCLVEVLPAGMAAEGPSLVAAGRGAAAARLPASSTRLTEMHTIILSSREDRSPKRLNLSCLKSRK